MHLVEINWKPTVRQLRQFGGLCAIALPLLGWWWGCSVNVLTILIGVGVGVALLAWLMPRSIAPLFIGLTLVTIPIGFVVGELAMLLLYGLVILPIGLWFRMRGRDRLQLRIDRQCESYWQPKRAPTSLKSYYRQS